MRTSRGARMFLPIGRLKDHVTPEAAAPSWPRWGNGWPQTIRRPIVDRSFELASFRDQVLGRTRQGIPMLAVAVAAVLLICCVESRQSPPRAGHGATARAGRACRAGRGPWTSGSGVDGGERCSWRCSAARSGCCWPRARFRDSRAGPGAMCRSFARRRGRRGAARSRSALSLADGARVWVLAGAAAVASRRDANRVLRPGARDRRAADSRVATGAAGGADRRSCWCCSASAGLLLESFRRLIGQDLGYRPQLSHRDRSQHQGIRQRNEAVARMYRALHARLAALPGVQAVGTISSAPLTGKWTFEEKARRRSARAGRGSAVTRGHVCRLRLFSRDGHSPARGTPLPRRRIEGRRLRPDRDHQRDGGGAAVSRSLGGWAALHLGNSDRVLEVVGVVKDTRDVRLEEKPQPRFYLHYTFGGAQVVVRSACAPAALMSSLREAVQAHRSPDRHPRARHR